MVKEFQDNSASNFGNGNQEVGGFSILEFSEKWIFFIVKHLNLLVFI